MRNPFHWLLKKTIDYQGYWGTDRLVTLSDVANILKGTSITKIKTKQGVIPVVAGGKEPAYFHDVANRTGDIITISASGALIFISDNNNY